MTGTLLEPKRETFLEPVTVILLETATVILLEPERETFLESPIDVFFDNAEEFLVPVKALVSDAESSLDPSLTSVTVRQGVII